MQRADIVGLFAVLAAVWIVLAASILVLSFTGSSLGEAVQEQPRDAPWTPSGPVIGGVWALLYTSMAVSIWTLNRSAKSDKRQLAIWGLIGFCISWPFYAFDTLSRWPGLLGNLGILAISAAIVVMLWPDKRNAALLILPVTVWISIATATILDGAVRYGW